MTTIDNNPPMPVQNVEYKINDKNNLTIEWNEPEGAVSYILESRNNFSRPWETLENIDYTKNKMVYEISNLSGGFHYYRIISVDRMGYQNADMEGDFLEIFIEYENINSATSNGSSSTEDKLPAFSIVQGSQFSRTTVFVCVGGCQREFENMNNGDNGNEIMCPHCGLMGDSPL